MSKAEFRPWVSIIGDILECMQAVGVDITEVQVGEQQYRDMTDGTLRMWQRDDLGPETVFCRPLRLVESPSHLGFTVCNFTAAADEGG